MTEQEVSERAREILTRRFKLDPEAVTPEMKLEELGVDSLDLVAVVREFESTFEVAIPTKDLLQLRTFGDIVQRCAAKTQASA